MPLSPKQLSEAVRRNLVHRYVVERERLTPITRIATGIGLSFCTAVTAILCYMAAGWSFLDSLYMVVITVFGVGYGEVHPLDSDFLRWVTIALIILGYAAAVYTVGGIVQLIINGELRKLVGVRRMQRDIERLEDHVVICGFGRMGSMLAQSLHHRGRKLLIIDHAAERVREARGLGYLAMEGNATEEEVLKAAGVERAAVLATVLSDDVANVFITITAHELNPKLDILARAEEPSTTKKLRQVGANRVILPAAIGADRLANLILRPSAESLLRHAKLPEGLNEDLESIGLKLDELEVRPGSRLVGDKISSIKLHGHRFGVLIIAVRQAGGTMLINPAHDTVLAAGDCVIMLAHEEDIPQLCNQFVTSEAL